MANDNSTTSQTSKAEQKKEELEKHKGVRGWLLFLCVWLTIINPLGYIFLIFMNYDAGMYSGVNGFSWDFVFNRNIPGMEAFTIISICSDVGVLIFGIVAGILLWKVKAHSVMVAKGYFWTMLVVSFLILIAGNAAAGNAAGSTMLMLNFYKALIWFSIWFTYLNRSKRIKRTYA